MIRAENLSKSFGDRHLWRDLTFAVERGSMVAVVGRSGAGKTTLLNCVAGLSMLDEGYVRVNGSDPAELKGRERVRFFRESVSLLLQGLGLVDDWTVSRNLDLALEPAKLKRREAEKLKARALTRIALASAYHHPIYRLSGGERQRVALARLMLQRGDVILADEPSSALDDANCDILVGFLMERRNAGASILVSTHDPRIIEASDATLRIGTSS